MLKKRKRSIVDAQVDASEDRASTAIFDEMSSSDSGESICVGSAASGDIKDATENDSLVHLGRVDVLCVLVVWHKNSKQIY